MDNGAQQAPEKFRGLFYYHVRNPSATWAAF